MLMQDPANDHQKNDDNENSRRDTTTHGRCERRFKTVTVSAAVEK